jgi:hypothetical protein
MKALICSAVLALTSWSTFAQYSTYPYKLPDGVQKKDVPAYTAVGVPNAPTPVAPSPAAPDPKAPDPKAPDWGIPQSQPMTAAQQATQQAQQQTAPLVNVVAPSNQQPQAKQTKAPTAAPTDTDEETVKANMFTK